MCLGAPRPVPPPDSPSLWQVVTSFTVDSRFVTKCHMNIIAHYFNYLCSYLVFDIVFRFYTETNSQEIE